MSAVLSRDAVAEVLADASLVHPDPILPGWLNYAADRILALARPENEVKAEALDEAAAQHWPEDLMSRSWVRSILKARATDLRSGGAL